MFLDVFKGYFYFDSVETSYKNIAYIFLCVRDVIQGTVALKCALCYMLFLMSVSNLGITAVIPLHTKNIK